MAHKHSFIRFLVLSVLRVSQPALTVTHAPGTITAVVSLLHELGAPETLGVLIEGESVLNDGTAFVLVRCAAFLLLLLLHHPLWAR